jgi:hypothetical protein
LQDGGEIFALRLRLSFTLASGAGDDKYENLIDGGRRIEGERFF